MYITKNTIHGDLYVVKPSKKHERYARRAREGSLLYRLVRKYNAPRTQTVVLLIALVSIVIVVMTDIFWPTIADQVSSICMWIDAVSVGLVLAYVIGRRHVQKVGESRRAYWATCLMGLPNTFEIHADTVRPAIEAIGRDWLSQYADRYSHQIDAFLCDPIVTEVEARMSRVDRDHPAYRDAAFKLRRIADGNLCGPIRELEDARMAAVAASEADTAERLAESRQQDVDALKTFVETSFDTWVTSTDVAHGKIL